MLYAEHGASLAELDALPHWHPDRAEADRLRAAADQSGKGHRPPNTPHGRYGLDPDLRDQIALDEFREWLIEQGADLMESKRSNQLAWRAHPHGRKQIIEFLGGGSINTNGASFGSIEAYLAGADLPGRIPPIRALQTIHKAMLCCDASVIRGAGAWGAALIRPGDALAQDAGGKFRRRLGCTLAAESQAIANGLWHFIKAGALKDGDALSIYCDNDAVINMLKIKPENRHGSKGWQKAKEPVRRAMAAIERIIKRHDLHPAWRKVNGHVRIDKASAPERLNGLADHAARRAQKAKCKGLARP